MEKDFLELDDTHQLFIPDKFGIDILDKEIKEEKIEEKSLADEIIDPLIQAIELEDNSNESIFFLIDTLDIADELLENNKTAKFEEVSATEPLPLLNFI